jgi:serine/threonine-protein kinase
VTLASGDRFGRYTIEESIGEGGMGQVYRAHDARLGRRVALKLLHPAEGVDPKERADAATRLVREARAAAALEHDNAIAVFDVGEVDGVPYIAMEYIAGQSLRHFIGDPSVPLEQRIGWLVDVARVLAIAHRRELIHRDIKPENVMIRDDGAVKVLDFGIARRTPSPVDPTTPTEPEAMVTLTQKGTLLGTPRYMAPEQLHGETLDGRADQFSWGVLAYELVTGRAPWNGADLVALIAEILTKDPPAPRSLEPLLPPNVEAVILRALAKSPADRFRTMDDLVVALGAARPSLRALPAFDTTTATGVVAVPRRRSRVFHAALLLAGGGALALGATRLVERGGAPAPSTSAGVSDAAPAPTALTGLPIPQSSSLEATAAFRAELQSARDGSGNAARIAFRRAIELDPSMGAAHLWVALLANWQNRSLARTAFARARELRTSMSERDQALVAALEPLFLVEPGDGKAAAARLRAAVERFPGDASMWLNLATVRAYEGDPGALGDADRALALDPEFVGARVVKGLAHEMLGAEAEALAAYDGCVAAAPTATSCLLGRMKIEAQRGECVAMETDARKWIAGVPADPEGYRYRAAALVGRGESPDAADELLRQARTLMPPAQQARRERVDGTLMALVRGDLRGARAHAEALRDAASADRGVAEQGEAARALVEIDLETGQDARAAATAETFLKRSDLWVESARIDQDPTPLMLVAMQRAHKIARSELEARRDAWVKDWTARVRRPTELWWFAYADLADSRETAAAALAALPAYEPLSARRTSRIELAEGRSYLLAGKTDEAIVRFRRGAASCSLLREPIAHMQVTFALGEALERSGDEAGACKAFRAVTSRWARATDAHSRSFDGASAHIAKLHCRP